MQAHSFNFAKVFANTGDIHYVLPHFQREYRWKEKHWETLWDDAILTHDALPSVTGQGRSPEHFLGALVVVPDGTVQGTIPVHRLVDGQQRLTTVSLLLCALGNVVQTSHPLIARRIRRLLLNSDVEGDLRFKVLPTTKNNDRAIYAAIIEGRTVPDGPSYALPAYNFFKKKLEDALGAAHITPDAFFEVLVAAFQVVWVELDRDENAYQIFESLNTKGEKLGQSDLVRNYIAMRLPSGAQEVIFFQVWAPIEAVLNDQRTVGRSGLGELTAFLRHYDAIQSGLLPAEKNIYARFRDEMKQLDDAAFVNALHQIKGFAALYDALLRPDKGEDPQLRAALMRLNALDISVAYPFLLNVSDRHARGEITTSQFCQACETLENYLVRRFLVDAPTAYLNKMFAGLAQNIDWDDFVPSLRRTLVEKQYLTDARVRQILPTRPLYDRPNSRERSVMLYERINAHLYTGSDVIPVLVNQATLEHVLPQTLTEQWKTELGEEAEDIAREWRHTLGNLTLVTQSYNSSLSNGDFSDKKARLVTHGLRLNSDYFSAPIETWNAPSIRARADWLTDKILEIWPSFAPAPIETAVRAFSTPTRLTIRGEEFPVGNWRDVLRQAGEFLVRQGADFEKLSTDFPNLIHSQQIENSRDNLSNGWTLKTNWSASDAVRQTTKLLRAGGVGDEEWSFEDRPN